MLKIFASLHTALEINLLHSHEFRRAAKLLYADSDVTSDGPVTPKTLNLERPSAARPFLWFNILYIGHALRLICIVVVSVPGYLTSRDKNKDSGHK
ncbi:hypothetical protein LENED_001923 [Lentinula edodes]|uniref:Uncharacterized protein n=1 Tax=Lentinula edodes TaxID=5353 RepID=A0A1Q3DZG0_LENED|nr:hypothetical protein LENED_001923 [Lentinula edodes]